MFSDRFHLFESTVNMADDVQPKKSYVCLSVMIADEEIAQFILLLKIVSSSKISP